MHLCCVVGCLCSAPFGGSRGLPERALSTRSSGDGVSNLKGCGASGALSWGCGAMGKLCWAGCAALVPAYLHSCIKTVQRKPDMQKCPAARTSMCWPGPTYRRWGAADTGSGPGRMHLLQLPLPS